MNVAFSLTWTLTSFIMLTLCYMVIKTIMGPNTVDETESKDGIILAVYGIACFIIQVVINISNATAMCQDSPQPVLPIFIYTMLPFFFIFGSIIIMIKIKKGWLGPFSNTMGYLIAIKLMGGAKAALELGKEPMSVNDLNKSNYKTEMGEPPKKGELNYNKLYKMVILKDTISEVIWYLLSGCLAISVANNIVMNVECDYDPKTMAAIKKNADEKFKNSKKPVIYQTKHY